MRCAICSTNKYTPQHVCALTPHPLKSPAQEVFTEDNPRLSISGWYHAAHAPDNADQASLQQLQRGADAVVDYTPFTGVVCV